MISYKISHVTPETKQPSERAYPSLLVVLWLTMCFGEIAPFEMGRSFDLDDWAAKPQLGTCITKTVKEKNCLG